MSIDSQTRPTRRPRSRLRRWTVGILKWVTIVIVVLLVGTTIAGRVLHARDDARWKAPGKLVDVGEGRRMHIYCTGSGSPTVVLEAGLGDFSIPSWNSVQPQIAAFTRVCSYDRAATGWSDASPVAPTPDAIVGDLYTLLAKSGEPAPYVLAGHSLGGPIVRHYAVHHPEQVAALVLVDGSHEDQTKRLPKPPGWFDALLAALPAINALGIDRTAMAFGSPDSIGAISAARTTRADMMRNTVELSGTLDSFFDQVRRDARPFGDLPLIALSAGVVNGVPGWTPEQVAKMKSEWHAMHKEIVARSTRGKWILAEKSAHYIQRDQPDLVIQAVKEMVDSTRARPVRTP